MTNVYGRAYYLYVDTIVDILMTNGVNKKFVDDNNVDLLKFCTSYDEEIKPDELNSTLAMYGLVVYLAQERCGNEFNITLDEVYEVLDDVDDDRFILEIENNGLISDEELDKKLTEQEMEQEDGKPLQTYFDNDTLQSIAHNIVWKGMYSSEWQLGYEIFADVYRGLM